jgi:single-strand DNA-binding protein
MLKETLKTLISAFRGSTFVTKKIIHQKNQVMKANRIQLIGYVGKDLATTVTRKGSKRVCIRMATHYRQKNTSGEPLYHTVWHDVVAWDQKAEHAERNFIKGSRILVEGVIDYRTYPDKSGHTRYITEIRADSLMNLDR